MRNTILAVILGFLFVLFLASTMTVSGRGVRQNELEQAVNRAVEQTAARMKEEGYGAVSDQEILAELNESILRGINSDCALEIRVLECGQQAGVLSVQAVGRFRHPNGKEGSVSAERTVVWEKHKLE